MKQHQYRITIEQLSNTQGEPVTQEPFTFLARNHDNLFNVIEKVQSSGQFNADDSAAMALGLKLFTEIVLERRNEPLFCDFYPQIGAFMQKLKKTSA